MRGRKPKPTELKILAGTRSDRIHADAPKPVEGFPDPPRHLDDVALSEWKRIVPDLLALGVLSRSDAAAVAIYSQAFSRYRKAQDEIAAGGLISSTASGGDKANPAVAIMAACEAVMAKFLTEFGATPSSRGRIHTGRVEAPKDELSAFLSRRKKV